MTKVFLIEQSDGYDSWPSGIAATLDAAVAHVRKEHADYPVTWGDLEELRTVEGELSQWQMVGHFDAKIGLCSNHIGYFEFTEYEVIA